METFCPTQFSIKNLNRVLHAKCHQNVNINNGVLRKKISTQLEGNIDIFIVFDVCKIKRIIMPMPRLHICTRKAARIEKFKFALKSLHSPLWLRYCTRQVRYLPLKNSFPTGRYFSHWKVLFSNRMF